MNIFSDYVNCPKEMSGCRNCSGRLFHSIGPAVAKQRSVNWLHDFFTMHVRLSADCKERQPAAVTSIIRQLGTQAQFQPTSDRRGWNNVEQHQVASHVVLSQLTLAIRLLSSASTTPKN